MLIKKSKLKMQVITTRTTLLCKILIPLMKASTMFGKAMQIKKIHKIRLFLTKTLISFKSKGNYMQLKTIALIL